MKVLVQYSNYFAEHVCHNLGRVHLPPTFGGILGPSFSFGSCRGAILCLTGEGSSVNCAAGGINPLSIKLMMPFCASSSVIGGGNSYKCIHTMCFYENHNVF